MKHRTAPGQMDLLAWRPAVVALAVAAASAVKPEAPIVLAFRAWKDRPNARTMGRLLAEARPLLLRHLSRHLRDHPDAAEDLTQNCLLRMAEEGALWTFTGRGDLQSWIAVVARHAAVSYLRRPMHRELLADEPEREDRPSRGPSPEDEAILAVERDRLERALSRLEHGGRRRYVRMLRAYYLDGAPLRSIALSEGLPYARGSGRSSTAAKDLLYRARKALKREIDDDP